MKNRPILLPVLVFFFVSICLSIIQLKVPNNIILLDRFLPFGGWIELFVVAVFGAVMAYHMQNPAQTSKWRRISWTVFAVLFFSQLIFGIAGFEKFLMTGKLHLPVPAMIISGPLYRWEISFMLILFLSTVLLSGPAWCSQLCYFGAMDNMASLKRKKRRKPAKLKQLKYSILFSIIIASIILRFAGVDSFYATIAGALFGLTGIFIILLVSLSKGQMIHCISYCPIGSLINHLKFISPFRFRITSNCTSCMRCTSICKYSALEKEDIAKRKPGNTCTLCGDCVSSCYVNALQYKFPGLNHKKSRQLYLFISISLFCIFLAVARI